MLQYLVVELKEDLFNFKIDLIVNIFSCNKILTFIFIWLDNINIIEKSWKHVFQKYLKEKSKWQ